MQDLAAALVGAQGAAGVPRQAHDMVPTPEQVLATAKPVMTQE
jgi:hypothetical protein